MSVLIGFAVQFRAYLVQRFSEIPALGTMAGSLMVLLCAGIAYTDFKPVTRAWPSVKGIYLWAFFIVSALLVLYIVVLLYQNKDRMAALILNQPMPSPAEEAEEASANTVLASR
jgi:hypothetical protein